MAKARDIAALAGLAGLAYANRDKLFGGKKTYNEDAGDQKTSSYTGDTKKVEAKDTKDTAEAFTADEGYKSNVLKAITAPKAAPNDKAGNQGVLSPKSLTPAVKPTNLSLAEEREAKTKYAATREPSDPAARNKFYATGQDSDRMKVASRAAAAADRQRKMAKASSYKSGGMASSASKRADGIATKGKTRGRIC
jgi:hypothetical protein